MVNVKVTDKPLFFPYNSMTKVVEMGNVVELTTFQDTPCAPPVRKLTQETYLDLRTNEIKEYKQSENRAENVQSLKRSFAKLRAVINANVTTPENIRWVTLTYAENMQDTERLYDDFRKFWQRFVYYCNKNEIAKPEYIAVAEPQGRGAWHMHLLIIWDGPAPYLNNDAVLNPLWGHGFTKIRAVKNNVDNLGAYFSAYLADMPVDELKTLTDDEKNKSLKYGCEIVEKSVNENGKMTKKQIIKGGRLRLYPVGMNIFRTSRGVKKPEISWDTLENAEKKVQAATCTFRKDYEISRIDDETGKEETVTTIRKAYYNMKRPKMQSFSPEKENFFKGLDNSPDS